MTGDVGLVEALGILQGHGSNEEREEFLCRNNNIRIHIVVITFLDIGREKVMSECICMTGGG